MRIFLRGVSLGMLFSTVVISFFYFSSPPLQNEQPISISKATAYLEEQGLVVTEEGNEPKQKVVIKQPSVEPKEKVQIKETEKIIRVYDLNIIEGMSSEEVAAILYRNKIIKDANDFTLYLGESGFERKIQLGTYLLNDQMTYEDIGRRITNR
ncbi:hypothetical protein QTG56_23180 (plasmid) [Rossellomorea sp. AcN35-11]|nr:hypothetical protein [Rossellomorea aquimaris]WJV32270.1 hypothetical protein QTG56_23180 [Rossellomorea sp. AcN35-11]